MGLTFSQWYNAWLDGQLLIKRKTITFHHDAGHGWYAVPKSEVIASGAPITHFSYMDEEYVYLEEDWDITQFVNAIGGADNFKKYYDVVEKYDGDQSPIRKLSRFVAP